LNSRQRDEQLFHGVSDPLWSENTVKFMSELTDKLLSSKYCRKRPSNQMQNKYCLAPFHKSEAF
jgi:hypothetical protein